MLIPIYVDDFIQYRDESAKVRIGCVKAIGCEDRTGDTTLEVEWPDGTLDWPLQSDVQCVGDSLECFFDDE